MNTPLIPLTDNDGVQAVMGRDLHSFLEVGAEYRHWFPRMAEYGFVAGQDYTVKNDRVQDSLGREREATNHIISLDMAKEISMIQRTDKGKKARQYFIECERQAKEKTPAIPQTYAEALREAAAQAERAELEQQRADKAEKKAEILNDYKQSIEAGDGITLSDFGRKYFSEEQYMDIFKHLYANDYLIDQRGTRVDSNGKRKDGYDHMKPKAKGRKYFYLHEKGNHGGKRRNQTRVRSTMELALRDALIADGLKPNTHSTGLALFNPNELKELV